MRRATASSVVLLLLMTACSGTGGDDDGAGKARTPTSAAASGSTAAPGGGDDGTCTGIGTVPNGGQVTVVRHDGLFAVAAEGDERCLVRGGIAAARWAPTGNRLLYDKRVHYSSGRAPTPAPDAPVEWSRPRGTSLVALAGGVIDKYPAEGGEPAQVAIAGMNVEAIAYHPAGKHVAAVGSIGQQYGIFLATNRGEEPRLVTRAETTRRIDSLAFSHDGVRLYFVADHGGEQHLHRLNLSDGRLETLAEATRITSLHVSPVGGVSWRTGECGVDQRTHVLRRGREVDLPRELRGEMSVVGWIDAETVIFAGDRTCSAGLPQWVRRWRVGGDVEELASEVYDAQVRIALPEPPGPPPRAVFDIPESAAPA